MTAPLDGIRVLEVANWLAAPAAGALLADLGADVIEVEPPGGDVFRLRRSAASRRSTRRSSSTARTSARAARRPKRAPTPSTSASPPTG